MFNQRIKDDQRIADSLAERVCASFAALNAAEMLKYAAETCQDEDSRVLILDSLGVVQVDTDSQLNGVRLYLAESSKVLSGAASGYGIYDASGRDTKHTSATVSIFSAGSDMKGVFASAIADENGLLGVAIYISRVQEIYDSLREIQLKILGWLVVVALIVIVMSSLVLRTITKPVGELREGIAKMSGGDFSARVNVRGKTEFAELAAAFNGMSEKLETLDRSRNLFVSNASHELKTPLTSMKVLADSLMQQQDAPLALYQEFMQDIADEIERENKIINDLLSLVKMDKTAAQMNISSVDVNELIESVLKRLRPIARLRDVEVVFESIRPVTAELDDVKITQVFTNLVENAIKYNKEHGWVKVLLDADHQFFTVEISDSGIGIPESDYDHIFERFYRVDKSHSREIGGTGLGLAITRNAVLLHRGSVKVSSLEGQGTCFTVKIPLTYVR